jgi:hypothetical protein
MKKRTIWLILIAIFAVVLASRLYFAYQTPYFEGGAYETLRQVEHITQTGMPDYGLQTDNVNMFPPLFHYLLAFFNLFLPIALVGKIIPNILMALSIFGVYLLARRLTRSEAPALFTAFMSGFIPVLFSNTLNNVSHYTLAVPLVLLLILSFITLEDNFYLSLFCVLIFILPLVSPFSLILVLCLVVYIIFAKIGNVEIRKRESELAIFSFLLVFWICFLIYKKELLFYGFEILRQNLPLPLVNQYFSETGVLDAIYKIGYLPLLYGIYTIYDYLFKKTRATFYVLFSFVFVITLLLWVKAITPVTGYIFLGVVMIVLFSECFKQFFDYIAASKFSQFRRVLYIAVFITFTLTAFLPSISLAKHVPDNVPSEAIYEASLWLKDKEESVVLTAYETGGFVSYVSNHSVVLGSNFLARRNSGQIFYDVKEIYTAYFVTDALDLLEEYDVKYILLSDVEKDLYDIEELRFVNTDSFKLVYDERVQIYERLRGLKEI